MELIIDFKEEKVTVMNNQDVVAENSLEEFYPGTEKLRRLKITKELSENAPEEFEKIKIIEKPINELFKEFVEVFEKTSLNLKDKEEIEIALIEESGEIIGILKKMKFHKHRKIKDLDIEIIYELGDFLWYYIANLKINKKYDWGKIYKNIMIQTKKFQEFKENGTSRKIQDYNRNIENEQIGEYFAEVLNFVKIEYDEYFVIGDDFQIIIEENIKKLKKRYF